MYYMYVNLNTNLVGFFLIKRTFVNMLLVGVSDCHTLYWFRLQIHVLQGYGSCSLTR